MNKDSFYFSHDSNARNDEKLIAVRMQHDWKGYGLYWALIEKLRESTDYKLSKDYNILAYDLRTDAGLIKSLINDFGLFSFDEVECFYSKSLKNRMAQKDEKSKKAMESANKRWQRNANALPPQTDSNAIKESKVKESKVNIKRDDLFEDEVLDFFDLTVNRNFQQAQTLSAFLYVQTLNGRIDHFKSQFSDYKKLKSDKKFVHSFQNFIGNQEEQFLDGKWDSENWGAKLKQSAPIPVKRKVIDHSKI